MKEHIKKCVAEVVGQLVAGRYDELGAAAGGHLTGTMMEEAVTKYGRTLCVPPENAYDLMETVPMSNRIPKAWFVVMPLWTLEEGRSDLSLEMTLTDTGGSFAVEINDLHVL